MNLLPFAAVLFIIMIETGRSDANYLTLRNATTLQSSTINDFTSDLAIDWTWATCAVTGVQYGAWWKIDFGGRKLVYGVYMNGDSQPIRIRVGDGSDQIGLLRGFETNAVCNDLISGLTLGSPSIVYCNIPLYGKVLSIMNVETIAVSELRLCDVKVF